MPFYAVGVGKKPGIYLTWEECLNQTKGYPKAKFKKFNSQAEATAFVDSFSNKSGLSQKPTTTSTSYAVENVSVGELIDVRKKSSHALLKQDRLQSISEKLDRFIEETNKRLNEFSTRLSALEAVNFFGNTPDDRKRKSDASLNEAKGNLTNTKKKKKTVVTVEVDEETTSPSVKMTRSQSQSTQGATTTTGGEKEEVDGPWYNGFSGHHSNYNPSGSEFVYSDDGFVCVFTDGACSQNGRVGAKAGVGVWFNHNNPFNVSAPVVGSATNNNAEIQAATRAIEQANLAGITRLNIHTDSQFMINCITSWINKWKKNNWMTTNGGPVKNKEQLELLDSAIQTLDAVKWTHVRGHMGNLGNEQADELARRGATLY